LGRPGEVTVTYSTVVLAWHIKVVVVEEGRVCHKGAIGVVGEFGSVGEGRATPLGSITARYLQKLRKKEREETSK